MKVRDLQFDTPENAARSLLVLADLVLKGAVTIDPTRHSEAPKWIRLEVYDVRERG